MLSGCTLSQLITMLLISSIDHMSEVCSYYESVHRFDLTTGKSFPRLSLEKNPFKFPLLGTVTIYSSRLHRLFSRRSSSKECALLEGSV